MFGAALEVDSLCLSRCRRLERIELLGQCRMAAGCSLGGFRSGRLSKCRLAVRRFAAEFGWIAAEIAVDIVPGSGKHRAVDMRRWGIVGNSAP